jgi:RNA polymerase sigma factor (TIGR02999 family)
VPDGDRDCLGTRPRVSSDDTNTLDTRWVSMPASSQPQSPGPPDVTALLLAWAGGDRAALDALLPALYADLRAQAARALRREAAGHSLQPTALVHETYLRLIDQGRVPVESRSQFYGIAARVMRQILVDHARTRSAAKRGGAVQPVTLTDSAAVTDLPAVEILAVHEAIERLELLDPQQARLVELRYFAGLTIADTAAALGISPATAKRDWVVASAWLRRELEA